VAGIRDAGSIRTPSVGTESIAMPAAPKPRSSRI
jgi:hypothetical protein